MPKQVGYMSAKSISMDCKLAMQNKKPHRVCIYQNCDCKCHEHPYQVYHWGKWKQRDTKTRHERLLREGKLPEVQG